MKLDPNSVTALRIHTRVMDALGWDLPAKPLIVGARIEGITDLFDEYVGILHPDGTLGLWSATTEPGRCVVNSEGVGRWATHPAGAARVALGMHEDVYGYGHHHSRLDHPCMKQREVMRFERWDGDAWIPYKADNRHQNIHRAGWNGSVRVRNFSHGCLVFQNRLEHWHFLLALGYPEHGTEDPTWDARCRERYSLLVVLVP